MCRIVRALGMRYTSPCLKEHRQERLCHWGLGWDRKKDQMRWVAETEEEGESAATAEYAEGTENERKNETRMHADKHG